MDVLVIWRLLLRRKWILILVPTVAASIAFYYKFTAAREFRSTLQLATGFTVNEQVRVSDERFSLYEADVKFNNLIESINSPQAIGLLSYRLMLHDLQDKAPFRSPKNPETLRNKAFLEIAEKILLAKADSMTMLNASNADERRVSGLLKEYGYDAKSLRKSLSVKRVNFTDFVSLEYLSENPRLSAFMVNTLADEFLRYNRVAKNERSTESVDFFKDLVTQKRETLDILGEKMRQYKEANNVLNIELQSATNIDQISDLEKRRTEVESDINQYRLSIRRLDKQIGQLSGVGSTESRGGDNQKIVRLRNAINEMNSRYIAGGSSDRRLLDSIKTLRDQYSEMSSASATTSGDGGVSPAAKVRDLIEKKAEYETSLEVSEASLASISSKLNALRYNVSGLTSKEAILADIQREIDVATQEYREAQEKYNLAQNTANASNPLRIILRGLPPAEHEPSKTIVVTLLAGVASFFLCAFTIIFLEFVDTRVKSPFYFQKSVNMNLSGTLNVIKGNTDFAFLFDKNITDNNLLTFKQLIRKLRFEIERQNAKVILVTSMKQGEGKTFTILGLAFSLSLIQKKVLIIDTNFKNTALTKLLVKSKFKKLKGANGVTAEGEANQLLSHEPEDDFSKERDFISHTKYKNIHVIGSRVDNDSPSEILSGRDFLGMLAELKMVYDYIFLEGAAMNDFPDTKELIGYADKVVAVFSAESVVKQLDKDSISYLNQFNGKIVGAVLNRVEVKDLDL
ncbi:GumC family protein [Parachryseolinea silvisoli]|jgi:succinoglycan biosynthesis transport protein ExoP|uniref:GumC family protein n=1 Tax=Parachryseolinea silvisoli TaxID=2873601 RepID=UPI002265BD05|nr:tyrosine-protein kinase domain-containing protein [Parachryseolinea silvisoli]MCD9017725.1 AAA family ATPase [Parachryseolinea silvisoli]